MSAETVVPIQHIPLQKQDLEQGDLESFNQGLQHLTDEVNRLRGHGGPVSLPSGIDLGGSTIKNSGKAKGAGDLVSQAFASSQYGASNIAKQLESGGSHSLKSVRRIGDKNQRETNSTFLNALMSTSPTVNDATVSFGAAGGGSVTIYVSGGAHQYVDNQTVVSFSSRYDTVSLPATVAITSVTLASGVVTMVTGAPHGKVPGQTINVDGVTPNVGTTTDFNGSFVVLTTPNANTLTYRQVAPAGSGTGGSIGASGVYYYYLRNNSNTLSMAGPFTDDTQRNRLSVNVDGQVLIAVAVVTPAGGDVSQSSGGATSPTQTNGNRVINRV